MQIIMIHNLIEDIKSIDRSTLDNNSFNFVLDELKNIYTVKLLSEYNSFNENMGSVKPFL